MTTANQSKERQEKHLYKSLDIQDFTIDSFHLVRHKSRLPLVEEHVEIRLPQLASAGGKRLFLPVGYLTPKINLPTTADSLRRSPFQADSRGYTDETEISVALPEGYHIESVPEPIHYNEAFGSYQLSISADAPGQIFIRR